MMMAMRAGLGEAVASHLLQDITVPDATAVVEAAAVPLLRLELSDPTPCWDTRADLPILRAMSQCNMAFDGCVLGHGTQVVRTRDDSGHDWVLKLIPDSDDSTVELELEPEESLRSSMRQRAQTEAEIAGALSGQIWAVPIHSIFRTQLLAGDDSSDAVPMTVLQMPLMEGGDLRSRISQEGPGQPLPMDEALRIILQAVNALRQCHACGILHRDIKAENILFSADGRLHLGDFGMSGFLSPSDRPSAGCSGQDVRTTSSAARQLPGGSLELLSPARLLGGDDGTAGDWWALGVVVLELLAGSPEDDSFWPFRAPADAGDAGDTADAGAAPGPAQAWLQAVEARDVAFSPAVGCSGRELVRGLLHPSPAERWGLEEVVGCDFIPSSTFEEVVRRFPSLAADIQELEEIRSSVRSSSPRGAQ